MLGRKKESLVQQYVIDLDGKDCPRKKAGKKPEFILEEFLCRSNYNHIEVRI